MARIQGILLSVVISLFACSTNAQADTGLPPKWDIGLKVGLLQSSLANWDDYYPNDPVMQSFAVGYKFTRMFSLGLDVGRSISEGEGDLPLNKTTGGEVTFTLSPVNVSLNFRWLRHEEQQWVPYLGVGLSRVYYRQEVPGQAKIEGSADGVHYKLGLQYLLDTWDRRSAANSQQRTGLDNTYVVLEFMSISAELGQNSLDLGGKMVSIGILMEM